MVGVPALMDRGYGTLEIGGAAERTAAIDEPSGARLVPRLAIKPNCNRQIIEDRTRVFEPLYPRTFIDIRDRVIDSEECVAGSSGNRHFV